MKFFTRFSRFCSVFAILALTSFFVESNSNNGFGNFAELEQIEADPGSADTAEVKGFFAPPAWLFQDDDANSAKQVALGALPSALKKKAVKLSPSDFLSIAQIVEYGKGNFPKTEWNVFRYEVWQIAQRTKAKYPVSCTTLQMYDWMMKTFRLESNFRSDIKTPLGSAAGIFQCTKGNRDKLGFPKNWRELSPLQQLPWYQVYLWRALDNMNCVEIRDRCDFYMINFMPAFADKSDNSKLASACAGTCKKFNRGKKHYCAYHANMAFDMNKDGRIYKYEVAALLNKKFTPGTKHFLGSVFPNLNSIKVSVDSECFDMLSFALKMPLTNFYLI
jgi:hypothetical protein